MMLSVKLMLALSLLATLSSLGYAIRCHQCNDVFGPENCGVNDEHVVKCETAATACIKYSFVVNDKNLAAKDCYFGDTEEKNIVCHSPFLQAVADLSCDICLGDKCNGSSSLGPMVGVILLFFGVAGLLA
nr:three-finger toxin 3FTx-Oxy6-like [Drosophila takahashii]